MATEMELHDPFIVPDEGEMALDEVKREGRLPRVIYAYEMRIAGVDWDIIADKLNYSSAGHARDAVMRHIRSRYDQNDVDAVVATELARLDKLQLICWMRAKDGDLKAVQTILNIMGMRMKLLGTEKKPNEGNTQIAQAAIFIGGDQESFIDSLQQAREAAGVKVISG